MKRLYACLAGLIVAGAIVAAQTQAVPAPVLTVPDYKVGPQDVIRIEILTPSGSGFDPVQDTIGADGKITYPSLGQVAVADLTCREIEKLVKKRLVEGHFLADPGVAVTMVLYRSQTVNVQGAIKNPGFVTLDGANMTLYQAISAAGGYTMDAGFELQIKRPKPGAQTASPLDPAASGPDDEVIKVNRDDLESGAIAAPKLQNNDLIYVPKTGTIYVGGYVKSPGTYPWRPGMTLEKAILTAGGFADHASEDGVRVRRADPKTGELKFGDGIDKKKQNTYQLRENDYIDVPKAWIRSPHE